MRPPAPGPFKLTGGPLPCPAPGYFGLTDSSRHAWQGEVAAGRDLSPFPPDEGPRSANPRRGVVTVGAVPWIVNYNVPLATGDMPAARRVARAVSERGGGLRGVEVRRRSCRTPTARPRGSGPPRLWLRDGGALRGRLRFLHRAAVH